MENDAYYAFMQKKRNDIQHYGIKGMKKGTRRWTNEDGTLNEAGKQRYKTKGRKETASNDSGAGGLVGLDQHLYQNNPSQHYVKPKDKNENAKEARKKVRDLRNKKKAIDMVNNLLGKGKAMQGKIVTKGKALTKGSKNKGTNFLGKTSYAVKAIGANVTDIGSRSKSAVKRKKKIKKGSR